MSMTRNDFIDNTARLVSGLQAPVSLTSRAMFGAAYEPWSALLDEATGGFGWTNAETCREAFAKVLGKDPGTPVVVCLCGSTRFYDQFQRANYDLTMRGSIVLSVGFYPHAAAEHGHGEGVGHDSDEKTVLDELHKRKIDLADEVFVVSDETGYFGESTAGEIAYAARTGKPVGYLHRAASERAATLGLTGGILT